MQSIAFGTATGGDTLVFQLPLGDKNDSCCLDPTLRPDGRRFLHPLPANGYLWLRMTQAQWNAVDAELLSVWDAHRGPCHPCCCGVGMQAAIRLTVAKLNRYALSPRGMLAKEVEADIEFCNRRMWLEVAFTPEATARLSATPSRTNTIFTGFGARTVGGGMGIDFSVMHDADFAARWSSQPALLPPAPQAMGVRVQHLQPVMMQMQPMQQHAPVQMMGQPMIMMVRR